MSKLSRLETFVNCGFRIDPFKNVTYETGDSIRIKRILSMAIQSRAMISVVGDRGMGKTEAIKNSLKHLKVRQVYIRSADKKRLLITDIEQAMILDLSDEKPKRGREIRSRQLRRILGEASVKQDIVLVIEEGHRLHGQTLRALKTLREMDWMGQTELFSIILVGQSDPMSKAGVSEVRLRSDSVYMKGLSMDEICGYIQNTVGQAFEENAIDMIAEQVDASNFLDLQNILVDLMGLMLAAGKDKVDMDIVSKTLDISPAMPKKEKTGLCRSGREDPSVAGNDTLRSILGKRIDLPGKVVNG